jgi:DNA polymerase-3 subunit delta'
VTEGEDAGGGGKAATQPSLPWQRTTLDEVLAQQRGHALLLHGAPGDGSFEFALTLAQAWLCESGQGVRPCGECASCRLVQSMTHPDLNLRMPQTEAIARGWPVVVDANRKPSKQIRIGEVREAIDWISTTTARGRAKVLVLFPAEAMNEAAASALLKTLEEPSASARLLLCAAEPARLLPTVLSRCQRVALPRPTPAQGAAWLQAHGVADAPALLAATAGRPLDALGLHREGVTAAAWAALPRRVAAGDASAFAGWGVPAMLDALLKLCHDAMTASVGGAARFFPEGALVAGISLEKLIPWRRALQNMMMHADHPWNEPLAAEALVAQAREALTIGNDSRTAGRAAMDTLKR